MFSVLNVFLFSLYINRYNAALEVVELSDTPIEERLLLDNITVPKMDTVIQEAAYVSGNVHLFEPTELEKIQNQEIELKEGYLLSGTFKDALQITEENTLEKLVHDNVFKGSSYKLWKKDEENQSAIFFQYVNDRLVYNNQNAKIIVYWNDEKELIRYEQTLLDNLEDFKESQSLLSPMQAIKVLYKRALLKPESEVKEIKLGYSTLAQLTDTQVFAPTWHIFVELPDGTSEDYFVNAVEGRIIEIPKEAEAVEVEVEE